jgi:putative PIN family toxin of toxin-antitoxin system
LDTNSVVSALLLKQSVSRRAFDRARSLGVLLVSLETISELSEVLSRDRFNKYVTEQERQRFLAAFVREAELIEPSVTIHECRDPSDDKFLELAVSGSADLIISGDRDLLTLSPFRDITILSPGEFLIYPIEE